MSCLISASLRQRLAQVGTGLAIRRGGFRIQEKCHTLLSHTLSVRGLNGFNGPLSSRALVPRARMVSDPDQEFRELVEESAGVKDKLEEINKTQQSGKTIITVPVHLEKRLERMVRNESTKRAIRQRIVDASREGATNRIVIHCKNKDFNHYVGQSYSRREELPLASAKWKHKKSAGDFFTLFPGFNRDSPFYMTGSSNITFNELGVSQQLCDNLKNLGIERPTNIQVFAIPQIMKGGYNLVAAETGCGKTLAYVLPIVNAILEDKRYRVRQKPAHPSTLILVPSRELADQVYCVINELASNLGVCVKLLQGGNLGSKLKNPPKSQVVDILVATTNALNVLTSAEVYGLSKVIHIVLDEADTLLDDSFFPELVGPFMNRFAWSELRHQLQLTLVSATMPQGIKHTLGPIVKVDRFTSCTTPGLHYSLPHVPQKFMRVRKSHKPELLKKLVEEDVENNRPVLIFCNKSATCDWLSYYLNDNGIDAVSVHGRMAPKYRRGRVDMYQNGDINVLIATDLASRGIDTVRTQHVINYEFPLHMADYIHRSGRTGRVGSWKGSHVTNFISRHGEIAATQKIELSIRKEKPLPDVNANIKRLFGQWYGTGTGTYTEIQPIREDDEEAASASSEFNNSEDSDSDDESDVDKVNVR